MDDEVKLPKCMVIICLVAWLVVTEGTSVGIKV